MWPAAGPDPLPGRGAGGAGDGPARSGSSTRTRWSPTSSRWPAGWPRRWRSGRGPRSCPTCCRRASAGWPPYSVGARLPRTRVGAVALGSARGRCSSAARSAAGVELNGARVRVGLPPLEHTHGGISRQLALVATLPAARVPARASGCPGCGSPGRCCGSARSARWSCRLATSRWCWWRRAPRRTRSRTMLRAALDGLAGEPVRVLATTNRRPPERPLTVPAERARRRLALLRADDAALRGRGLPRGARHGGAGAGERGAGGRAAPPPATWPRTPRGWPGPGCGVSLPRRLITPRGVRLAVRKLLAEPGYAERARELRAWARAPRRGRGGGAGGGGAGGDASAARRRRSVKLPGVGLEPTTIPACNSARAASGARGATSRHGTRTRGEPRTVRHWMKRTACSSTATSASEPASRTWSSSRAADA